MKQIGDRIKENYENRYRFYLTRRVPVILRIDGCCFSTFTKSFKKPFDDLIIQGMVQATQRISELIQGFKCAYVQSDEVSILLTDYDTLETAAWFDYNLQKICSVTAALMTAEFQSEEFYSYTKKLPYFDCRAFNIPKEDVVNYFLWRALDWKRNSLNMYCSSFFSHKQLHNKSSADKHEMLHSIGKNWAKDLDKQKRNGTIVFPGKIGHNNITSDFLPTYDSLNEILNPLIYCEKD